MHRRCFVKISMRNFKLILSYFIMAYTKYFLKILKFMLWLVSVLNRAMKLSWKISSVFACINFRGIWRSSCTSPARAIVNFWPPIARFLLKIERPLLLLYLWTTQIHLDWVFSNGWVFGPLCIQIGIDFEDFMCSWLVVIALEFCNEKLNK